MSYILSQDDNMAIHREQRQNKLFAEYMYGANHMLRPSQSTDLNPIKHLCEILELVLMFSTTKPHLMEYLYEQ